MKKQYQGISFDISTELIPFYMKLEVSTINTIIGSTLAFIGSAILFLVGVIVAYVRQISRNTLETKTTVSEHHTEIHNLKDRVTKVEDKLWEGK